MPTAITISFCIDFLSVYNLPPTGYTTSNKMEDNSNKVCISGMCKNEL